MAEESAGRVYIIKVQRWAEQKSKRKRKNKVKLLQSKSRTIHSKIIDENESQPTANPLTHLSTLRHCHRTEGALHRVSDFRVCYTDSIHGLCWSIGQHLIHLTGLCSVSDSVSVSVLFCSVLFCLFVEQFDCSFLVAPGAAAHTQGLRPADHGNEYDNINKNNKGKRSETREKTNQQRR